MLTSGNSARRRRSSADALTRVAKIATPMIRTIEASSQRRDKIGILRVLTLLMRSCLPKSDRLPTSSYKSPPRHPASAAHAMQPVLLGPLLLSFAGFLRTEPCQIHKAQHRADCGRESFPPCRNQSAVAFLRPCSSY